MSSSLKFDRAHRKIRVAERGPYLLLLHSLPFSGYLEVRMLATLKRVNEAACGQRCIPGCRGTFCEQGSILSLTPCLPALQV